MNHKRLPDLFDELRAILRDQETQLGHVRTALERERASFVSPRGATLEDASNHLEGTAARLTELDERRAEVVNELANYLGIPARRLRVSRLGALVTGRAGVELTRQAERTRKAAEAVEVETRVGRHLLSWSGTCHESLLRTLAGVTSTAPVYSRSGSPRKQTGRARLLDTLL